MHTSVHNLGTHRFLEIEGEKGFSHSAGCKLQSFLYFHLYTSSDIVFTTSWVGLPDFTVQSVNFSL